MVAECLLFGGYLVIAPCGGLAWLKSRSCESDSSLMRVLLSTAKTNTAFVSGELTRPLQGQNVTSNRRDTLEGEQAEQEQFFSPFSGRQVGFEAIVRAGQAGPQAGREGQMTVAREGVSSMLLLPPKRVMALQESLTGQETTPALLQRDHHT